MIENPLVESGAGGVGRDSRPILGLWGRFGLWAGARAGDPGSLARRPGSKLKAGPGSLLVGPRDQAAVWSVSGRAPPRRQAGWGRTMRCRL